MSSALSAVMSSENGTLAISPIDQAIRRRLKNDPIRIPPLPSYAV